MHLGIALKSQPQGAYCFTKEANMRENLNNNYLQVKGSKQSNKERLLVSKKVINKFFSATKTYEINEKIIMKCFINFEQSYFKFFFINWITIF